MVAVCGEEFEEETGEFERLQSDWVNFHQLDLLVRVLVLECSDGFLNRSVAGRSGAVQSISNNIANSERRTASLRDTERVEPSLVQHNSRRRIGKIEVGNRLIILHSFLEHGRIVLVPLCSKPSWQLLSHHLDKERLKISGALHMGPLTTTMASKPFIYSTIPLNDHLPGLGLTE